MKTERSCGAVIYRIVDRQALFLVLRHAAGHWSFAKGHVEPGESEVETALREIKEETGLDVSIDENFRVLAQYSPKKNVMKDVVYFVAQSDQGDISVQQSEIHQASWEIFENAFGMLTYVSDKEILRSANEYLLEALSD